MADSEERGVFLWRAIVSPSKAFSTGLELPPAFLKASLLPDSEKVMLCFPFLNLCINFELLCFDFLKGNTASCLQRLLLADTRHLCGWPIDGLLLKDFLYQKVDGSALKTRRYT